MRRGDENTMTRAQEGGAGGGDGNGEIRKKNAKKYYKTEKVPLSMWPFHAHLIPTSHRISFSSLFFHFTQLPLPMSFTFLSFS